MKAGEICTCDTAIITPEDSALKAAQRMLEYNVGCLVVVQNDGRGNKPVGIITDRDLTLKVTAGDAKPSAIKVSAVMSESLLVVKELEDIYDILRKMHYKGSRRVPVVDQQGYLVGLLSLDDILEVLNREMREIIGILHKEQPKI